MVLHKSSIMMSLFMLLPERFTFIESVRIGTDCTTYYRVTFRI